MTAGCSQLHRPGPPRRALDRLRRRLPDARLLLCRTWWKASGHACLDQRAGQSGQPERDHHPRVRPGDPPLTGSDRDRLHPPLPLDNPKVRQPDIGLARSSSAGSLSSTWTRALRETLTGTARGGWSLAHPRSPAAFGSSAPTWSTPSSRPATRSARRRQDGRHPAIWRGRYRGAGFTWWTSGAARGWSEALRARSGPRW